MYVELYFMVTRAICKAEFYGNLDPHSKLKGDSVIPPAVKTPGNKFARINMPAIKTPAVKTPAIKLPSNEY